MSYCLSAIRSPDAASVMCAWFASVRYGFAEVDGKFLGTIRKLDLPFRVLWTSQCKMWTGSGVVHESIAKGVPFFM